MATITSVHDGEWKAASTWDSNTVPTPNDDVIIKHRISLSPGGMYYVAGIEIDGGGLICQESTSGATPGTGEYTVRAYSFDYIRRINDTQPFRLDGAELYIRPGIYCRPPLNGDGFPYETVHLQQPTYIIEDPGYFSQTATLQDVKPEGCGDAYARKVSNNVRFLTFNVRIPQAHKAGLRYLYFLASSPFQVIAITDSCVIKGYIETVAPDPSSVGKEFITVKVTVAEGPRQ